MSDSAELRPPGTAVSDAMMAATSDGILVCGPDGTVRHANDAAEGLFGYSSGDLVGRAVADLLPAAAAPLIDASGTARGTGHGPAQAVARDGRRLDVEWRLAPIREAFGEVSGVCLSVRPARGPGDPRLGRLVECSHLVGRAFCEAMVGAMAEALAVRTVLLARIDPADPGVARTVAVWTDGALVPNFEYALKGTPCGDALESTGCIHLDDVGRDYPDDPILTEMGARAYLGAPLRTAEGRVIGLLAAIHDRPLDPSSRPETIMANFAARAAAELERETTVTYNEYLGRLLEGSLSEVYVFDSDTLRFRLVNKGARENLGYTMDELQALTPLDLKPDYSRAEFEELIEPLRRGEVPSVAFRTRHRRKDGTFYPVEVNLQLITGFGAPVYFAAIQDVTERAAAEVALRRTEARLRRLFAQSPAGIIETDVDGRIVLVNQTWCDMLGYDEDEILGMSIFDVTHPDSLEETREVFDRLAAGTEWLVIEKSYRHKDGQVLYASSTKSALHDENGRFQGVASVVLDISERMLAEERIREKEALLRRILDGTLAFIGVLEPDGTLIEANAAALTAGGLTREEVIGRKFWDCDWWAHDTRVVDRLKAAVERVANGAIERYDEVVRMQGDTRMTIDFMLSPVRGDDGRVQFLVPSGFDISDRKRQEARVVNLMHEVNHRSKNLLTVVQSIARQMPKSSPEDFAKEFGRRLQALAACQDLLIRSGWEDVPLETLIRSQLMHFVDLLGKRITLDGPPVTLTPAAAQTLGMAVYELTTNAAKYGALSNDAGAIRIDWSIDRDAAEGGRFTLDWRESGGPAVEPPKTTGFGSVVLDHLVGMTLDAECRMDLAPDGLSWRLSCALEKLHAT